MPDIKLIALDLDGTLLNSEKQLSEENRAALQEASEKGVEIVPTTGRFYRGMPGVVRELPFIHYVISVNGAEVYDVRSQKALCRAEIPWERAVEVMKMLDNRPLIYDCYQNGWGWISERFYEQVADYAINAQALQLMQKLRTPVPELKDYLAEQKAGIQKISLFFNDMEYRAKMHEYLSADLSDLVITTAIGNNLEINCKEAVKGNALMKLADHLGLSPESLMACGDDLNDITMLKAAGLGVAMENAKDEVKAIANYVTDDNNHDGVAKAIRKFVL